MHEIRLIILFIFVNIFYESALIAWTALAHLFAGARGEVGEVGEYTAHSCSAAIINMRPSGAAVLISADSGQDVKCR